MSSRSRRKRTKPLTPEPFESLSISRLPPWSLSPQFAQDFCKFCPDLDFSHYHEQFDEEKEADLDRRASELSRRALHNRVFEASEFNWEADAWHDVFGLIRNDDTFRMLDKRPYEFIKKDAHSKMSVARRIPDATMGLRTYSNSDLDHGYTCDVVDCKINHNSMQPRVSLLGERIDAQMHDEQCGLIVDGIWGASNLIFPFAVYEAKKRASTWEQAENQVYHAFKVYLAMLDDLARDPLNITEYQSKESMHYQIFGFTSCASYWKVYIAWNFMDKCHAETIWEGDIIDWSRAYELICLVDQVHDFAANQHREFVIRHLEPWLGHAEDREVDLVREIMALQPNKCPKTPAAPRWLKIKEASKQARNTRAAKTRSQNRLKVQDNARIRYPQTLRKGKTTKGSSVTQIQLQRTRGRRSSKLNDPQPKRPRGRPRKCEQ
ncbi:hypothetical protein FB567DRAFT_588395 [Paraphoma chrysanthemicola]|uniref:Uncharacterized protein n=1 Tax=Paraphoma chrysanthemicola TaxID=798071 RepID=A0A8K0RD57_9PLEO|nr:hypothetical protein FB567DRAFT_588395 [Paraphoma chrysanthemicola]